MAEPPVGTLQYHLEGAQVAHAHGDEQRARAHLTMALSCLSGDAETAMSEVEGIISQKKEWFGDEDVSLAASYHRMAGLSAHRGDVDGAEQLWLYALKLVRQEEEPDAFLLGLCSQGLGMLACRQGRFQEGLGLLGDAVAAVDDALRRDHPVSVDIHMSHAGVRAQLGQLNEAVEEMSDVVEDLEEAGQIGPQIMQPLRLLAALHRQTGDEAAALKVLERLLEVAEGLSEEHDEERVFAYSDLGELYTALERFDDARTLLEKALGLLETLARPDDPVVAGVLVSLGCVNLYGPTKDFDASRDSLERAYGIHTLHFGQEHPESAATLGHLAMLEFESGSKEDAEALFNRTVQVYEKIAPKTPALGSALNSLAIARHALGNDDGAREAFEAAATIFKETLGADHPQTVGVGANLAALDESRSGA